MGAIKNNVLFEEFILLDLFNEMKAIKNIKQNDSKRTR